MFRDETGAVSAMRVAFLGTVAPVMLIWSGLSLAHGRLEEIPGGAVAVVSLMAGAKAAQSKLEQ